MIVNYINPGVQLYPNIYNGQSTTQQNNLIYSDPKTGLKADAYEGAKMIFDGRLKESLADRSLPSVTWLGKKFDGLIDYVFKRNILQSEPSVEVPVASPQSVEAPIAAQIPAAEQTPQETPIAQPTTTPATTIINNQQTCGSILFDTDTYFGSIYIEEGVPSNYDCICVNTNTYVPAKTLKVYYGDYTSSNQKSYTFTAKNITATFTSENYLPKGLIDHAEEILNPIFQTINSQCAQSDYQDLQLILGVTIPGGALVATIIALGVFYRNRIAEACGKNTQSAPANPAVPAAENPVIPAAENLPV